MFGSWRWNTFTGLGVLEISFHSLLSANIISWVVARGESGTLRTDTISISCLDTTLPCLGAKLILISFLSLLASSPEWGWSKNWRDTVGRENFFFIHSTNIYWAPPICILCFRSFFGSECSKKASMIVGWEADLIDDTSSPGHWNSGSIDAYFFFFSLWSSSKKQRTANILSLIP